MTDFSEFLGALLTQVAHARRMADEETAAIAEHYRDHPLLEGMAVPRIRLPEVSLDVPLLINAQSPSSRGSWEEPAVVVEAVVDSLDAAADAVQARLPPDTRSSFSSLLRKRLEALHATDAPANLESSVRTVDNTFSEFKRRAGREFANAVPPAAERAILSELRSTMRRVALKSVGEPSRLDVSVETGVVKESAPGSTVARLRLVIREEGVEWSVAQGEDGQQRRSLTPE